MARILINQMCLSVKLQNVISFRAYHADNIPRITVPHKMIKHLEKQKLKISAIKHQKKRSYSGHLLIACKRRSLNHYKGQTYSNFSPQMLASRGWKNNKSKMDYFSFNPYTTNPSTNEHLIDNTTYEHLGILPELTNSLVKNMEITSPTLIQVKSIPSLLKGLNCLCASETGGGKTLAYLLPTIQKILKSKIINRTSDSDKIHPRAIILLPTKELVHQVYGVAKTLCQDWKITIQEIYQYKMNTNNKNMINEDDSDTDVLVATPGMLYKYIKMNKFDFTHLQTLILDEMDTLLDDSFNEVVTDIFKKVVVESEKLFTEFQDLEACGTQLIMIGATIPLGLERILSEYVPVDTIERIQTPYVHCLMPHISQKFLRMGKDEKEDQLVRVLSKKKMPTMVFCNNKATVFHVYDFLKTHGISATLLDKHRNDESSFLDFRKGIYSVLVCTDIASRGLDTTWVQRVINYDFPNFVSDYIHRAGRVGRVGSGKTGNVLSFVSAKWEVDLLWKIETSARHAKPLPNVNANIKRKLVFRKQKHFLSDLEEKQKLKDLETLPV